jgi:hypothetical protein
MEARFDRTMNFLGSKSIQFIISALVLWVICALLVLQGLGDVSEAPGTPFITYVIVVDGALALFFTLWGVKLMVQGR